MSKAAVCLREYICSIKKPTANESIKVKFIMLTAAPMLMRQ